MSEARSQTTQGIADKQIQTSHQDRRSWQPPLLMLLESGSTQSGKTYFTSEQTPYCSGAGYNIPPAMLIGPSTCTYGGYTGMPVTSGPS